MGNHRNRTPRIRRRPSRYRPRQAHVLSCRRHRCGESETDPGHEPGPGSLVLAAGSLAAWEPGSLEVLAVLTVLIAGNPGLCSYGYVAMEAPGSSWQLLAPGGVFTSSPSSSCVFELRSTPYTSIIWILKPQTSQIQDFHLPQHSKAIYLCPDVCLVVHCQELGGRGSHPATCISITAVETPSLWPFCGPWQRQGRTQPPSRRASLATSEATHGCRHQPSARDTLKVSSGEQVDSFLLVRKFGCQQSFGAVLRQHSQIGLPLQPDETLCHAICKVVDLGQPQCRLCALFVLGLLS